MVIESDSLPANPISDFEEFFRVIKSLRGKKIWIHCAANARVSVFMLKYRCSILGEGWNDAIWDLREIWEPFGTWKTLAYEDAPSITQP